MLALTQSNAGRRRGADQAPDPAAFHQALAHFNHRRMAPTVPHAGWDAEVREEASFRIDEGDWLERERAAVQDRAAQAPRDPQAFVAWFEALKASGPGQGDILFPWLETTASHAAMRWFLTQEAAGEAGFDDLVALTQLKLPPRPKLELARNYWDEMGRGNIKGMHGPLLTALIDTLGIEPVIEDTAWESLALANLMLGLATSRRYAYHSVGALGVVELTSPGRVAKVAAGLRRLGFSDRERRYFDLHAVLDVKHSESWNAEALIPLIESDPALATPIAEGALMRLVAGERCFRRYRAELWAGPQEIVAVP